MNDNYHAIIHKPYEDISGLVMLWDSKSEAIAVAQHDKDNEISRIHCHILIIGCKVKKDNLTKDLHKIFPGIDGRQDFRIYTQTHKDKEPITPAGLWYLLKGDITALKYNKNFSDQQVEEALKHYDSGHAKRRPNSETAEKDSKPNQYAIIQMIRGELGLGNPDLQSSSSDNKTTVQLYKHDYDKIMDTILDTLDKHEIKVGMYDIEKWFVSVVHTTPDWRFRIKGKIISKLQI